MAQAIELFPAMKGRGWRAALERQAGMPAEVIRKRWLARLGIAEQ